MAKTLDRRTMLKGFGAALGLPLLEAMLPSKFLSSVVRADEAVKRSAPLRMLFINQPNGVWMDNFKPAAVGPLTDLPPTLKSLEPLRQDFSVLSGLALDNANAKGDGPGDHARSGAAFLTGAHPRKTKGSDIKLGVSVDQYAASHAGQTTRLPSLELGCDAGKRAGDCDSGYSCAYVSNISWAGESTPMPKLVDPAHVFDRIFGKSGASMLTRLQSRKSILDFVSDETSQLQKEVGLSDQRKLVEFTTALREVERRIEQNIKLNSTPVKLPENTVHPEGIPHDYAQHIRLMYDLLALSFQTDVTRIGTFLVANEGSNRNFGFMGIEGAHHEMSHHGANADKIAAVKKIDKFYYDQFAYFLKRLKDTKEVGGGSLLDNCMIMLGSGIGDGDRHNHDNLPILLAGGGGGSIKQGRHIAFDRHTPLCNLYVSMLDRMGVKTPRFGDSTGALKELS